VRRLRIGAPASRLLQRAKTGTLDISSMDAWRTSTIVALLPFAFLLGGDSTQRADSREDVQLQEKAERLLPRYMYSVCRDRQTNMALLHDGRVDQRVCARDGVARATSNSPIDSDTAWSRLRAPYHRGR
jgi:hypothetical protein